MRFISAALTAFLLISCTPGIELVETTVPTQSARTPASTSIPATPTPIAPELPESIPSGIVIEIWHPWSGKMANLANEMIEEFNENNPWSIRVQESVYADEQVLMQQISHTLETEEDLPDLIAAPDYYLTSLIENGIELRNQDEFLSSPVWGIPQADLDRFFPVFLDSGKLRDQQYSFPAYRTGHYLFYNQTWAEELGFSQIPETPEGFEEQTCAAARVNQFGPVRENIGTGGWVYSFDSSAFFSWLKAFDGSLTDPAGRITNLQSSGNIEGSSFLYDLFLPANNCAWLGRQSLPYQYLANRQAIAYSGTLEDILIQELVNEINGSEDEWTVIPYPSISSRPVLTVSGISYGITSSNEEKSLAAWEFIKWMSSTRNQVRIVESTASFPLSASALESLTEFRSEYPAWSDGLIFLPLVVNEPASGDWIIMQDILSDISWQLIQFTTSRDDIQRIWENAEMLLEEISEN